jgi:hypothetical protein
MTTYTALLSGHVRRNDDLVVIPADPANTDYAAYLAWVFDGNMADMEAPPPPAALTSVPMWKAKGALAMAPPVQAGPTLLDDANAAVAAGGGVAAIYWEYATELHLGDPEVAKIAALLGLSAADVDALFMAAATLTI